MGNSLTNRGDGLWGTTWENEQFTDFFGSSADVADLPLDTLDELWEILCDTWGVTDDAVYPHLRGLHMQVGRKVA